jgi:hypothetical protein
MKTKYIYPIFPVTVQGNKLVYEDEKAFKEHLIPYEGKKMGVAVKRIVKERSRAEEKYYYKVVVRMVAEEMDIPREDAHKLMAGLFLTVEESDEKYRYKRVLSTTELTDDAYREYWEKCVAWASLPTKDDGLSQDSGLNLYIPYPNEVDYENAW